jgi:hypothetical protein
MQRACHEIAARRPTQFSTTGLIPPVLTRFKGPTPSASELAFRPTTLAFGTAGLVEIGYTLKQIACVKG